ncbi:Os01g0520340 [Oryza sativa Japonica Group]|uniref:Os01g0520340 protein n=1 Tax=Oryza sativa subsp. japonica TaxID=39947 RepID=A0A0P0V3F0_ORYSJ|nr:hypothetical protein EE612_003087 [Oryza sativa]BAS72447.1 Os01g0520340 [Oryza sativa Japonica Group]
MQETDCYACTELWITNGLPVAAGRIDDGCMPVGGPPFKPVIQPRPRLRLSGTAAWPPWPTSPLAATTMNRSRAANAAFHAMFLPSFLTCGGAGSVQRVSAVSRRLVDGMELNLISAPISPYK